MGDNINVDIQEMWWRGGRLGLSGLV